MDQTLQDDQRVPAVPPHHQDQQYRTYPVPPYLLNSLQDDQKDGVMQYRMEVTSTVSDQSTSLQQGLNKQAVNSRSISNVIRVCSNCHTTTTPLWRSGPSGPKSLCNACGIRQRKARRAALMAMEAANGGSESTILPINKPKTQVKKPRKNKDQNLPYKKRYKFLAPVNIAHKKSAAKSLLFCKEFPKEEADAATLLMGLSCGVLRG